MNPSLAETDSSLNCQGKQEEVRKKLQLFTGEGGRGEAPSLLAAPLDKPNVGPIPRHQQSLCCLCHCSLKKGGQDSEKAEEGRLLMEGWWVSGVLEAEQGLWVEVGRERERENGFCY